MGYVITNDKYTPAIYLKAGESHDVTRPTQHTTEIEEAKVFVTIQAACDPLHHRPDLYRAGWRVVPR